MQLHSEDVIAREGINMVIASRFLRVTTPYMQGPDVIAVQRRLLVLGYYTGPWDGVYNTDTRQAVVKFQQASGLHPDGIVGPMTWTALGTGEVQWGGGRYHINVDNVRNMLFLYDTGKITASYRVSTGKNSTPTPLGDWVITEKYPNPGGEFGAAWMRLSVPNGGYAIHGTNDPQDIGRSVSHGCIRMNNPDVTQLYNIVPMGTLVTITGQVITHRVLHLNVSPGPDVTEVQDMLQALGYYRAPLSRVFDANTDAAVRSLQRDHQLVVDGIVGSKTAVKLQAAYDIARGDIHP